MVSGRCVIGYGFGGVVGVVVVVIVGVVFIVVGVVGVVSYGAGAEEGDQAFQLAI